jgi:glutamate racemase
MLQATCYMQLFATMFPMKIGVFDSGVGGLSILREILKVLPQYSYLYLGDSARVPYGSHSPEVVYEYTRQAMDFLFSHDCKLVILACNTATTTSLQRLQKEYVPKYYPDRNILGVVRPATESVVEGNYQRIGIIGTEATIKSKSFVKEIKKSSPNAHIFQQACPLLVPIIEEGEHGTKALNIVLSDYLAPLQKQQIDSIILGCTHYGLIERNVQKILGKEVEVIAQGKITAKKLKSYLARHPEIEAKLDKKDDSTFYFTEMTEKYKRLIKLFLGKSYQPQHSFRVVKLEEEK